MTAVTFAEQIRAQRLHLGLTQAEAAERAGLHRAAWARAESGGAQPDVSTLERMAAAVGLRLVLEEDDAHG